jgi:murein DD-endopeptidase MepM/ murein hydrolase activator NlpD
MLRAILIFVVGALAGGNAVYFAMTRGDRCARCAPVATAADARTASATTAAPPATASSATGAPTAAAPTRTPGVTPPPFGPSPLPAATTTAANAPKLAMPLPGLTATQLRDTFAETRGGERAHEALDLIAPAGTPVLAVADGHIEKLFTSVRGGLTIYQFDPTGRYAYYYAHLQRYAPDLREGEKVKQGQVIAYVGSTGNADPAAPHLHFAVFELGPERQWWKGTAINPYPLLGGTATTAATPPGD